MPDYSADPNYSEILYDVDGPVLTITLNRPDKLNAFTFTMMMELLDAFDRADADDDVRAVIITGAGWSPKRPRRGSCRASWASARRWSG
jgi:1,4-dihydroxy-2-naphthoyl-CoA synthase